MNDFKSCSSEENIAKSCIFESKYLAIVLRCWNSVEYIHKIIISFLTVLHDEMNYGVRHIKLFKNQNQPFAGFLQDSFFFLFFLNSQKYNCVGVSFILRLQVNFDKIWWAIFLIEQLRTTASENERLPFFQNL